MEKKACIKRQCIVISQPNFQVTTTTETATPEPKAQVTAIKSEPVFSVKTEPTPTISIAPSPAQLPAAPVTAQSSAPTLLSWPGSISGSQYAPTFQLQVQQPVQFAFQPGMTSYSPVTTGAAPPGLGTLQYTAAAG